MTPWNGSLNPRQTRPAEPQLRILGLINKRRLQRCKQRVLPVEAVPPFAGNGAYISPSRLRRAILRRV